MGNKNKKVNNRKNNGNKTNKKTNNKINNRNIENNNNNNNEKKNDSNLAKKGMSATVTSINEDVNVTDNESSLDARPQLSDFMGNANDIFSTSKQKYENTMSSAIILLTFGCIGLLIQLLGILKVINLPMLSFQYVLMFLVFVFFIFFGVHSYKKAISFKNGMVNEEKQKEQVDYFLNDLLTDKVLMELKSDELSEEENYVLIIEKLQSMILEKYPEYDKELLEYMIDDYLNEHFSATSI